MKGRKWMMIAALAVAALLAGCGDTAGRDSLESSGAKGSQEGNETIGGNTNSQDMQEDGSEESADIPLGGSGAAETGDAQDGEKVKNPVEYTEYEYDENGNMVKWWEYKPTGEGYILDAYAELEYDQRNNLTKRTNYRRAGYGSDTDTWIEVDGKRFNIYIQEWEYDGNGNVTKGKADWIKEWECDSKGNLIASYELYGDEFEYDENGNLIWEVRLDTENVVSDAKKFEYDQYGRLVCVVYPKNDYTGKPNDFYTSFHDNGGTSGRICYIFYEYDAAGRLVREVRNNDSTYVVAYDYVYDENGNKVEKLFHGYYPPTGTYCYAYLEGDKICFENVERETVNESRKWEYDEAGNVIKELSYHTEKWWVAEEWEYDDQGNVSKWTESPEGPGTIIHMYQYYDDGSLKIDEQYYASGEIGSSNVYDRAGTLILTSGHGVNINSLEYDDAGMIRKLKYGDYEVYYEFEYDGEGRVVKISH